MALHDPNMVSLIPNMVTLIPNMVALIKTGDDCLINLRSSGTITLPPLTTNQLNNTCLTNVSFFVKVVRFRGKILSPETDRDRLFSVFYDSRFTIDFYK